MKHIPKLALLHLRAAPRPRGTAALCAATLLLAALASLSGCSDHGHSVHLGDPDPLEACGHFLPTGLRVDDATSPIYSEFHGVLRGDIALPGLGLDRDYALTFFDSDSSLMEAPGADCPNHWLEWTVGDTTVVLAEANPSAKWGFHLRALRDGTTTLRLRPIHFEDGVHHSHFLSREITIRARDGGAGVPLTGVRLEAEGGEIARERRGAVHGGVWLAAGYLGVPITVHIFGANSEQVDPTTLSFAPSLNWELADTNLAVLELTPGDSALLRLRGRSVGQTSLRLTISLRDRVEYVSAAIPVVVAPGHLRRPG